MWMFLLLCRAEDFMGKVDGVQLCCGIKCSFLWFGEVLTSEMLPVILMMTKAVCILGMPEGALVNL